MQVKDLAIIFNDIDDSFIVQTEDEFQIICVFTDVEKETVTLISGAGGQKEMPASLFKTMLKNIHSGHFKVIDEDEFDITMVTVDDSKKIVTLISGVEK